MCACVCVCVFAPYLCVHSLRSSLSLCAPCLCLACRAPWSCLCLACVIYRLLCKCVCLLCVGALVLLGRCGTLLLGDWLEVDLHTHTFTHAHTHTYIHTRTHLFKCHATSKQRRAETMHERRGTRTPHTHTHTLIHTHTHTHTELPIRATADMIRSHTGCMQCTTCMTHTCMRLLPLGGTSPTCGINTNPVPDGTPNSNA